jgi:hypothetical protein
VNHDSFTVKYFHIKSTERIVDENRMLVHSDPKFPDVYTGR